MVGFLPSSEQSFFSSSLRHDYDLILNHNGFTLCNPTEMMVFSSESWLQD